MENNGVRVQTCGTGVSGGAAGNRREGVRHLGGQSDGGGGVPDQVGGGTGAGAVPHLVGLDQDRCPATPRQLCDMIKTSWYKFNPKCSRTLRLRVIL